MTIDTTKPNSARIYDYVLGGTHNYPADRAAAKQVIAAFPTFPQTVRLYRYFLHIAAARIAKAGFDGYLDLATGIPTEGYLHTLVPDTAKIIYNDIEPETVAYAQEILGDRPNILCVQSDLREIDPILEQAEAFFGPTRKIGVFMVNVSYFIEDSALHRVLQQLYAWCAPRSMLAISGMSPQVKDPEQLKQIAAFYERIGTPLHYRTPEDLLRLAAPWQEAVAFEHIENFGERSLGASLVPGEESRGELGYGGILIR